MELSRLAIPAPIAAHAQIPVLARIIHPCRSRFRATVPHACCRRSRWPPPITYHNRARDRYPALSSEGRSMAFSSQKTDKLGGRMAENRRSRAARELAGALVALVALVAPCGDLVADRFELIWLREEPVDHGAQCNDHYPDVRSVLGRCQGHWNGGQEHDWNTPDPQPVVEADGR